MFDYLKGSMGALAVLASLLIATPATALPSVSEATFAVWPTNYCSTGAGEWDVLPNTSGGMHIELVAATYSKQTTGGTCLGMPGSAASAGIFSVWGRVEREWPYLSNTWSVCKSAPWTANANGNWIVYSYDSDILLGCGAGRYRLRSENRITYGGINQYSPPLVSAAHTFGNP